MKNYIIKVFNRSDMIQVVYIFSLVKNKRLCCIKVLRHIFRTECSPAETDNIVQLVRNGVHAVTIRKVSGNLLLHGAAKGKGAAGASSSARRL